MAGEVIAQVKCYVYTAAVAVACVHSSGGTVIGEV